MLETYLDLRKRKMNQTMTVLADCISLEEPIPMDLIEFINHMGSVYELRGTAFRGVVNAKDINNNIYNFWCMYTEGKQDLTLDNLHLKLQFLEFIDKRCELML